MVYLNNVNKKIRYSLLITHYSEYKHPRENKALQYSNSAFIAHALMLCILLLGYIQKFFPVHIILCNCFMRSQKYVKVLLMCVLANVFQTNYKNLITETLNNSKYMPRNVQLSFEDFFSCYIEYW